MMILMTFSNLFLRVLQHLRRGVRPSLTQYYPQAPGSSYIRSA